MNVTPSGMRLWVTAVELRSNSLTLSARNRQGIIDAGENGVPFLKLLRYSLPIALPQKICRECLAMHQKLMTPWKPSKAQILAARDKFIPDIIAKNLIVLFAGINPGLYTAAIGRHFGRPGNRFWPALYGGGFTPRLFSPFENSLLLDLGYGITNVVKRATARADELTDDELRAGGRRLQTKVRRWRPTVVAFVGIHPYRVVSGNKDAHIGLQKPLFGGSHAWVLPNPSGLNAHYPPAALAQLFGDLRVWAILQHEHDNDKKSPTLKGVRHKRLTK